MALVSALGLAAVCLRHWRQLHDEHEITRADTVSLAARGADGTWGAVGQSWDPDIDGPPGG